MSQGPVTWPFLIVAMTFLVASLLVAVNINCFYSDRQLATLCNFLRHFHVFLKRRRSYIASHHRSLLHTGSQDSKKPYKTPERHARTDDSSRVKNMVPEMVQIFFSDCIRINLRVPKILRVCSQTPHLWPYLECASTLSLPQNIVPRENPAMALA